MITGTNVANNTIVSTGVTKSISSLSITPGIWIVSFFVNCYPDTSATVTNYGGIRFNLSTTIDTFDTTILLSGTEGINYSNATVLPTVNGITPLNITSTTTYYLNATITYTSGPVRTSNTLTVFKATRIA